MTEQVSIGRYTGFEPIGSGGFSRVYRAWRADQDRYVAVKVLALESGEIDREAFAAECRAMGAVSSHPNVVTAFDNGFTNEGYPFIAMELCPDSLADQMKAAPYQRLETAEVLSIGAQIFAALEQAHAKGILHRDVKPQNILFTEFGLPALTDFGIAALADESHSQETWAMSRHYAAPEVIDGESQDASCDIYALGATMYTALAGRRPFSVVGDNGPESLEARIRSESPPALDPDWVPDEVAAEIMALLAKNPRDRPRTAGEAAQRLTDLQVQLGHVTATPESIDTPPGLGQPGTELDAEPDEAAAGRRLFLAAALLVLVVAAVVIALIASRGDETNPSPPPRPTVSVVDPDDVVVVDNTPPDPPSAVTTESVSDGLLVSWDPVATAERYRVDFFGTDREPILVTDPELTIERDNEDVLCLSITAVNESGRLSRPSEQVCG